MLLFFNCVDNFKGEKAICERGVGNINYHLRKSS